MTQTRQRPGGGSPGAINESANQSEFSRDDSPSVRQIPRRYVTAPVTVLDKLTPLNQHRLVTLLLKMPKLEETRTHLTGQQHLTGRWFGGTYDGRRTFVELWQCKPQQVTASLNAMRSAGANIHLWSDANQQPQLDLEIPLGTDRRCQLPEELLDASHRTIPVWLELQRNGNDSRNRVLRAATGQGHDTVRAALRELEALGLRTPITGELAIVRRLGDHENAPSAKPSTPTSKPNPTPYVETSNPHFETKHRGTWEPEPPVQETVQIHPSLNNLGAKELEHFNIEERVWKSGLATARRGLPGAKP